jgi:membrane protein DedA with SNARE-associated domain
MTFWEYCLVFMGAMIVDIVPLPLPPAFTVMIFFQITFNLNIWAVIFIGVAGSIIGRWTLTMYIPLLSNRVFNHQKNEDVQFLGKNLMHNRRKMEWSVFIYSLMPLLTTPLFIASGMAKIKPGNIIVPFIFGKFISDSIAVLIGKYAVENSEALLTGMISWKTITGLVLGLILVFAFLWVDWRFFLRERKIKLRFNIWK